MERIFCVKELFDGVDGAVKQEYAVCVSDGKIARVGPADEIRKSAGSAQIETYGRHIMLPAFIDAHDHARGVSPAVFGAKDRALELWIPTLGLVTVPAAEAALYDGLLLASSGVGSVVHCHNYVSLEDVEGELLATVEGYNKAGVRVALCPPYVDQNSVIYHGRDAFISSLEEPLRKEFSAIARDGFYPLRDYFELMDRLAAALAKEIAAGRAALQMQAVGAQWCSDEALVAMKEYAVRHGIGIQMHLLETKYQMLYAKKRFGCGIVEHLGRIGVLGPWLTCAHAVWLDEGEMEILKSAGVKCVVNPSSNLRLRSGQAKLARMLSKGCVVGLGLDGSAFDDDQDYLREMRAAFLNSAESGVNAGLKPRDVLKMALANGAAVAGGKLSPGWIAKGEAADFILLDTERMRAPYCGDAEDSLDILLRRGTRQSVAAVYSGGECVVRDGACLNADLEEAARALGCGIEKLRRESGAGRGASAALIEKIRDFYTAWEVEP